MSTTYRFRPAGLHHFVAALFTHLGSSPTEAALVADHLIAANLAGHDSHGVGVIPSYVKSHAEGYLQLNHHASVIKDAGAVMTLDGNAGFGQVVAYEAIQLGIEKAKLHGMAAIALRNAHHIGRIGHWAEQCAAQGFISIHFVSVVGDPLVAPFRGKDRRFGTNPICMVFPREGHSPLLLDYATSAIAFGKTRVAWHKGDAVPADSLIDYCGEPTTDPAIMQTSPYGALLTFAQHKGYALATLCEVLGGAVSGGQTTNQRSLKCCGDAIFNCMTTIILSPEAFDAPDMQKETEDFIDWCKQSPQDAEAPILAPGEWEAANRQQRLMSGIPLDASSWRAICTAARQAGMSLETLSQLQQHMELNA